MNREDYEKQLQVATFNKKEIEEIARKACFNFIDLTSLGKLNSGNTYDEETNPGVVSKILKEIKENYDSNKVTIIKYLMGLSTITSSDTSSFVKDEILSVYCGASLGDETAASFSFSFDFSNQTITFISYEL